MNLLHAFRRWRAKRAMLRTHKAWVNAKTPTYGEQIAVPADFDVGAALTSALARRSEEPTPPAQDGILLTLNETEAKFLHSLLGNHVFGQGESRLTNFAIWHALNVALDTECVPLPVEAGRGQVWIRDNGV